MLDNRWYVSLVVSLGFIVGAFFFKLWTGLDHDRIVAPPFWDFGGRNSANSQLEILPGDPHNPGSFLAPLTYTLNGVEASIVALADMNGDGLPDVVIGDFTAQKVTVLLNDPSQPGQLLPAQSYPAGGPMFDLAIGDMSGDVLPDVILGGVFADVIVLLGDSSHPGLVAGTDFEMAESPLFQQREHARVPRNHLPQLIHPGPRSAEKRAGSAPQVQAAYTSLTALARCGTVSRSDRRCHLY